MPNERTTRWASLKGTTVRHKVHGYILVELMLLVAIATGFSVNPTKMPGLKTNNYRTQSELKRQTNFIVKSSQGATITKTSDNTVVICDAGKPVGFCCINNKSVEQELSESSNYTDSAEANTKSSNTTEGISRSRRAAVANALLKPREEASAVREKVTSIGPRRIGSASKAKAGTSKTAQLLAAVRKIASAASSDEPTNSATLFEKKSLPTTTMIQSTIDNLLQNQVTINDESMLLANNIPKTMGLLGDPVESTTSHRLLRNPLPGTILIHPNLSLLEAGGITSETITVRVATTADDFDVANLRLSVFSDFSAEVRKQFCARSIQALSNRRLRGATSLVASIPAGGPKSDGRTDVVLGSVELSMHEFFGTELGKTSAEDSILYITEVAVNPAARRCGIGLRLLQGVNKLAAIRDVESLYLHVDVTNTDALGLYEKAGFSCVDQSIAMYQNFTRSLNLHDGATKGRKHYLLCKHLKAARPWADEAQVSQAETVREVLGIQVPC